LVFYTVVQVGGFIAYDSELGHASERLLEKRGKDVLDLNASECMTANPRTIGADEFAAAALALMEEKKITSLVVINGSRKLLGIVHLHDLWGTEMM
jgi:arabinose-5-phosphate isomerase